MAVIVDPIRRKRAQWRVGREAMFQMLGYACYAFAVVDLGTYYLGIADITGVSWSPIAAAVLGSVLVKMDGGEEMPIESEMEVDSHDQADPHREHA